MRVAFVAVVMAAASVVFVPVIAVVGLAGAALGGSGLGQQGMAAVGALGSGIPAEAMAAYVRAAGACPGLSWAVVAAIGEVETDHGRSMLPGVGSGSNPLGAQGPMQFLPATFGQYAVDDGDGDAPNPFDIGDAALAAARMLCSNGAAGPGGLRQAIWVYNHSDRYVDAVLGWAARYQQAASSGLGASRAAIAVSWALSQLGAPYRWGATGPDAYDCSGLTLRAWEAAGVSIPRVAADQYAAGPRVPLASAEPGDLVFFATDDADPASVDHVGLVIGRGVMIDAPHSGAVVRVTPIYPDAMPEVVRPG